MMPITKWVGHTLGTIEARLGELEAERSQLLKVKEALGGIAPAVVIPLKRGAVNEMVLGAIPKNGGVSAVGLSEKLGHERHKVDMTLRRLHGKKLIEKVDTPEGVVWRRR